MKRETDGVEVLLTSSAIAERVRYVLDADDGERFAVVAFVGAKPLRWIKRPNGLQVFCWPSAGGTHPDGIDALIEGGAKVAFVERLHTKVYHSARGTVLGSPNLSGNALTGTLFETAVYLGPGVFPINEQIARFKGSTLAPESPEFGKRLALLRLEHNAYRQRNPAPPNGEPPSDISTVIEIDAGKIPSFTEWFNKPNRAAWQLGVWSENATVPEDVQQQQKENSGTDIANFISGDHVDKYALGMPTLECQYFAKRYGIRKHGVGWWFPKTLYRTADEAWSETPFFFTASERIPAGCSVPFDATELRFIKALSDTVHELDEDIERMMGPVNDDFVEALARHYFIG